MKSEHSPEPWYSWTGVVHVHIFDKDNIDDDSPNRPIATIEINDYDTIEQAEADAARIVACVNALRGLNPEHVGELVCAVERIVGADDKNDPHELRVWIEEAGELLAKVKG